MPEAIASVIMSVFNRVDLTADRMMELDRLYRIRHDFEIIIIDNGSTDQTAHNIYWWKHNSSWGRFVTRRLKANIGFGPAINKAAKLARTKKLICISNDVIIKGDFIGWIIEALDSVEIPLLCGPRVVDWAAGWNEFPPAPHITYVEGWLFGLKASLWNNIGGFDPIYAPHDYEDIDLSYTITQRGGKLLHLDRLPVEHLGAATIGFDDERAAITKTNRKKFAKKWKLEWTPVK